jgi:hypothetical protein
MTADAPVAPVVNEKAIKASTKEGAKLGMDLTGSSEMGGTEYFVTTLHNADGDYAALMAAKVALIEECTTVGVLLVSAGKKQLVACAIVPEDKAGTIPANEWLASAFKTVGYTITEGATATYAEGIIVPKEGEYSIKIKDSIQAGGIDVLRTKGKLPADSDSGEDFVFGDDDLGTF